MIWLHLIGIFVITCRAQEDKCKMYIEKFNFGWENYDNQWKANEFLAKNGYVAEIKTEPFSMTFVNAPLPRNVTNDIINIDHTLRGLQSVMDDCKKKFIQKKIKNSDALNEISECIPNDMKCRREIQELNCDAELNYRAVDGTCNNLKNPRFGSILTPYGRLIDAKYEDDILEIRQSTHGNDLISPRILVNEVMSKKYIGNYPIEFIPKGPFIPNMGWYMFSQMITHDVAGIIFQEHRTDKKGPVRCCSTDYKTVLPKQLLHENCLPFKIPKDDEFHKTTQFFCHNFIRSQAIFPNDCKLNSAQQMDRVTHFLDLSVIYGLTDEETNNVRTLENGLLKTGPNNLLPIKDDCETGANCYFTGDFRAMQTPSLGMMHTFFVKLHNVIAQGLKILNPDWDDQKLFQESRRINVAIYQHIIYNDYLPLTTGELDPYDGEYNDKVDPSTFNDFASAIFRNLHLFTPSHIQFYNRKLQLSENIEISKLILSTKDYFKIQPDDIVRGLIYQEINYGKLKDEITNKLFNGMDLISVDIQRGRDHGIPPYYMYRELCNLKPVRVWDDLMPSISINNIRNLKRVYSSPLDIDLYVGSSLEETYGNLMGPTFNCIMKKQFSNYKFGDRYFYTHKNSNNSFTNDQLNEITKFSFTKLLCTVTNESFVPISGFLTPNQHNALVSCNRINKLNLMPWLEKSG